MLSCMSEGSGVPKSAAIIYLFFFACSRPLDRPTLWTGPLINESVTVGKTRSMTASNTDEELRRKNMNATSFCNNE